MPSKGAKRRKDTNIWRDDEGYSIDSIMEEWDPWWIGVDIGSRNQQGVPDDFARRIGRG